jgi:hypothetical protein
MWCSKLVRARELCTKRIVIKFPINKKNRLELIFFRYGLKSAFANFRFLYNTMVKPRSTFLLNGYKYNPGFNINSISDSYVPHELPYHSAISAFFGKTQRVIINSTKRVSNIPSNCFRYDLFPTIRRASRNIISILDIPFYNPAYNFNT